MFNNSLTIFAVSFCHPCEREDSGSFSLQSGGKSKDPGSSIKNVEDDRRGLQEDTKPRILSTNY